MENRKKINISIDDVSPHPQSSTLVLDRCYELIDVMPDIKFTLFVPISYWRTMRRDISTDKPLLLTEYPDFCEKLRNLSKDNFEIGYHGFHHGIPGKTDNDEFMSLDYDQASEKFDIMFETVEKCNLKDTFKPIFRPPAWRMSPSTFTVCKERGIETLGLYDGQEEYLEVYAGEDKKYDKVVYANVMPPLHPLQLFDQTEIVYHACEWDKNYLSIDMAQKLQNFLLENREAVEFCFIGDMA
tara:strand:+ start:902 stop:1624 length:723 start_codon:yes stop_codon:yes gene_type:complete